MGCPCFRAVVILLAFVNLAFPVAAYAPAEPSEQQQSASPIPEPNSGFVEVAGGWLHGLALRSDYSIVAWGSDEDGQCTLPSPSTGFTAIAAGFYHSLGLRSDSTVAAFGENEHGQCDVPEPNSCFIAVAAGGYHSLALRSDGVIVAWGDDTFGQCSVPEPDTGFVAIAAGGYHSLGLRPDGTVVAWGDDTFGQCAVPASDTGFVAISAGMRFSMGLRADGTVAAWGDNTLGQCMPPDSSAHAVSIACGGFHGLLLGSDGSIVAWGDDEFGQCSVPEPNSNFVAVAAGIRFSLGVRADGSVVAWGIGLPSHQPDAPPPIVEPQPEPRPDHRLLGLTITAGTEGIGAQVTVGVSNRFNARTGFSFLSLSIGLPDFGDGGGGGGDNVDLTLQAVPLLVDWHPDGKGFRFTAGIMINGNKFESWATPGSSVEVNGTEYEVESYSRTVGFSTVSPYIGIGGGNAVSGGQHFCFSWDLGLLFHGTPEMDIEAIALNPSEQSDLEDDIELEMDDFKDGSSWFIGWPVISLGLSYGF